MVKIGLYKTGKYYSTIRFVILECPRIMEVINASRISQKNIPIIIIGASFSFSVFFGAAKGEINASIKREMNKDTPTKGIQFTPCVIGPHGFIQSCPVQVDKNMTTKNQNKRPTGRLV